MLMVQWVIGSIPHGGPFELFLIQASATCFLNKSGLNGAVIMSSTNGLIGTGFASWYRLQPRTGF